MRPNPAKPAIDDVYDISIFLDLPIRADILLDVHYYIYHLAELVQQVNEATASVLWSLI